MVQKRVYSTLAEQVVFCGTEEECNAYKDKHESDFNSLYILN